MSPPTAQLPSRLAGRGAGTHGYFRHSVGLHTGGDPVAAKAATGLQSAAR